MFKIEAVGAEGDKCLVLFLLRLCVKWHLTW